MLKRSLFVCALMMSAAVLPARADDVTVRMDQLEEQLRQLTGQVEQLTYQLKQMQAQAPKKLGSAEQAPAIADPEAPAAPKLAQAAPVAPPLKKKTEAMNANAGDNGVEQIGEQPITDPQISGGIATPPAQIALAPKPAGLGTTKSANAEDGGFQGKVLVPAGGDDTQATTDTNDGSADQTATDGGTQQASLEAPQAETPDDLYMRANQALVKMHYDEATVAFKDFIDKYPDHPAAGNAEYWLGESYWYQQDFSNAAQAYLNGAKKYPKGSRAADSMLKLGMSLSRLGQKDQACTTLGSIDDEYPKAVEAKKRAQAEIKREGCAL
ncbi:tol-pal system protein YbgF [Aestuariivirga litoralis]|uniref:tol-pal system protein YbgF n=1 Tax=Aestuariivirga litoralis TaxID=2650924 RepID=UPI0018C5E754|nr:tol-pal system protein YbgF [Aestuariivirga litoralis]